MSDDRTLVIKILVQDLAGIHSNLKLPELARGKKPITPMIKFSWQQRLSRRHSLLIGISAVTTFAILVSSKPKALAQLIYLLATNRDRPIDNSQRKFTVVGKDSLAHRAKASGLIYGAFPQADDRQFARDRALQASFVRDCGMITVGCYWYNTRPSATTFDFTASDYFVKFAAQHRLRLRGHPLLWHEYLPTWVPATLTNANAERILTQHIETLVRRYTGKMHSWDVLNEAIDVGGQQPPADGIRQSIWFKFLGRDYIDLAFRTAAKADPRTKLVYNDYGVEYDAPEADAKREAILNLLQQLKAKGTPIHALGIQSHLVANGDRFNREKFREFLKNVAGLGLKILLTELDVSDRNLPLDIATRDRSIASAYEDYLTVALAEKATISVTTWGLSDRYTWLATDKPRPDKSEVRPLPLDRQLQPKLAWNALARAFDRAPRRSST